MHYKLQYLFIFFVMTSVFLGGDGSEPPFTPSPQIDQQLPQVSIHVIGWDGRAWFIGGNTFEVFDDGFAPRPLLVRYNGTFTDMSYQLDIGDRIVDNLVWNGEYWLITHSFHEYGGLTKYDGQHLFEVPLSGEPLSLRVTALDWNGEYWLIGSGYVGYGYLLKYDGVDITDVSFVSPLSAVRSITWVGDSWLLSGTTPERVEKVMNYDGETFTEVEKPEIIGTITNAVWNGDYPLVVSNSDLIRFDGNTFDIVFSDSRISSLAWNGEYWLIGGNGTLTTYDGTTFTDLPVEFTSNVHLEWNGEYWLLGDTTGILKMYDGEEFTDLTPQFVDALNLSPEPSFEPAGELFIPYMYGVVVVVLLLIFSYLLLKKRFRRS